MNLPSSLNLTYRVPNQSDWDNYLKLNLSPEVNRYIREVLPDSDIRSRFNIKTQPWTFKSGGWLMLVLEDNLGEFVGYNGFHCFDLELKHVEVGYMLTPEQQGKGYATESLKTITKWGRDQFDIHKFVAYCSSQNVSSQRVLEKSGFQQEGLLRENIKIGQNWSDDYVYGLLSREIPR
ncbi:N-acetyltransferase [Parashewanella curva]|uniref:N-acetyltransferase n=1 Tax=Parashewanella curva TaxID=2338552 RepID=A0A3L8Q116_9GAMM|nr:GNAT family protein [Parashewanella curva]RLV60413.1 N-acetyltransferase [Parashewanella curva]